MRKIKQDTDNIDISACFSSSYKKNILTVEEFDWIARVEEFLILKFSPDIIFNCN